MTEQAATDGSRVYRTSYDTDSETTPTEAVVRALADAEGTDPVRLPPLYESVEPDAVNQWIEHDGATPDSEKRLGFTHHGWHVAIWGDGTITVREHEDNRRT